MARSDLKTTPEELNAMMFDALGGPEPIDPVDLYADDIARVRHGIEGGIAYMLKRPGGPPRGVAGYNDGQKDHSESEFITKQAIQDYLGSRGLLAAYGDAEWQDIEVGSDEFGLLPREGVVEHSGIWREIEDRDFPKAVARYIFLEYELIRKDIQVFKMLVQVRRPQDKWSSIY